MKRPIAIIVLAVLLIALVYSQRHVFFRSLAEEVKGQMDTGGAPAAQDTAADSSEAVRDTPAAAEAFGRGMAFYREAALDSAAAYFRKAQQFDPYDPAPFRRLALVRARQGRPGDALREMAGAAALDSSDVWTWVQLGKIRAQLGEAEAARADWARALALDPGNAVVSGLLEVTSPPGEDALSLDPPEPAPADTAGAPGP